ncbi:hypothetical protein MMC31_007193, partial [Peltigera leucophlebia]|nr:hypothetical protein [Peltigera leucophlebia]
IYETEYTSSYQAAFDKVASLLADSSLYTRNSTEAYFQATMLMNIGSEYSALVSAILKGWKTAETTNLPETILQITRHFEFMKGTANDKSYESQLRSEHPHWLVELQKDRAPTPSALKKVSPLTTRTNAGSNTPS